MEVGDFNTYTAQLLTMEDERIVIQNVLMAVNMSVSEEQISNDDLAELLALRSACIRTTAGVFNLVGTFRLYWRLIVKYHN